jgi:hypothetical protein
LHGTVRVRRPANRIRSAHRPSLQRPRRPASGERVAGSRLLPRRKILGTRLIQSRLERPTGWEFISSPPRCWTPNKRARFILGAGTQFSRATICEAVHSRREQRKSSFPKPSSTERERAAPDDHVQLLAEGQLAWRIRNKATSTVTFTHTEPADHFSTLALHRHSEPLAHGDERRVGKTAKLIDLHARLTFRPACHSGPAPPASAPFGCQTTHTCTD